MQLSERGTVSIHKDFAIKNQCDVSKRGVKEETDEKKQWHERDVKNVGLKIVFSHWDR